MKEHYRNLATLRREVFRTVKSSSENLRNGLSAVFGRAYRTARRRLAGDSIAATIAREDERTTMHSSQRLALLLLVRTAGDWYC